MLMILAAHIVIAIASLILALYTLFAPTHSKLTVSYALIVLTVISGFYMMAITPSHMMQACVSGLVYLSVVFVLIASARRKLLAVAVDKK